MELVIKDLQKKFEKKEVLRGIDFSFEDGKIYGLLGRNGAGKTTLFNCLSRDIRCDGGEFFLRENGEAREIGAEELGYVLSTPTVPEFLTGREFVRFFLDINRKNIENLRTEDEYFQLINLEPEDRDKLMKDYSHGMKNKMQMLINIIAHPKVLLLDEPLTSLDVVVAEEMKEILRELKKDSILILSTHIMELALDLCDEIVLLNHGVLSEVEEQAEEEVMRAHILSALREEDHV